MKSHKALTIGLILTFIIIVGAFLVYWFALRSPRVSITPSPANAAVQIDGNPVHAIAIYLTSGSHKLKVTASGYVPYEKTIEVKRAQTLNLNVLLKPIPSPIVLSKDVENYPSFAKGSEVFFLGNKGKTLYHTRNDAGEASLRVEAMTPDTLSDIKQVIWRPDGEVALLKRTDGVYLYDFMRYDLLHQTMTLWGTGIDDIVWDPNGSRTAYTYYGSNGEQTLKFADVQNKETSIVANLQKKNIDHPALAWSPNGLTITLVPRSTQVKTNYLYTLDIFSKKITQITDSGEVAGSKWSPDSKLIAYAAPGTDTDGKQGTILWVANADGSGVRPLNVAVSNIEKASWVNNSASLIVAKTNATGNDTLVNVAVDGTVTPYNYTEPQGTFSPQHLITVPGDERVLFFNEGTFMSLPLISSKYE